MLIFFDDVDLPDVDSKTNRYPCQQEHGQSDRQDLFDSVVGRHPEGGIVASAAARSSRALDLSVVGLQSMNVVR